jgi:hypothetical protein
MRQQVDAEPHRSRTLAANCGSPELKDPRSVAFSISLRVQNGH